MIGSFRNDISKIESDIVMRVKYIIFFLVAIMLFMLSNYSSRWLVAAAAMGMIFLLYGIYASRLRMALTRSMALEQQIESLHDQLDNCIRKEERTRRIADQVTGANQRLMATMSHEIRTPMNGIMGMATLLGETPLSNEQREYTDGIRQCGELLISAVNQILVDDILNFSKSGEENKRLDEHDFDLRSCLEDVLDMFAGATHEGVDLLFWINDSVPEQITGDSKRLKQILVNLMENAVKYTSKGEIVIEVHLVQEETDGKIVLEFVVRDSGTGIPASKIEGIFKGLSGKGSSGSEESQSSGLGLVVCSRLVEMMGGMISVLSEPGSGATFTFSIQAGVSRKPLRNSLNPGLAMLEGKHILIVDDNPHALALLEGQLKQWNIRTTCASSGRQALDLLSSSRSLRIDGVITDEDMPVMKGRQLMTTILERHPGLPVILLVGAGYQDQARPEISTFQLAKPVKRHLLRDRLLYIFSQAVSEQKIAAAETESSAGSFSESHPLRILVAEDNAINQKIALKMLSKLGYEPVLAANGKQALDILGQERFDLVLMDVQMPEMDGLEATRMLRLCLDVQPVVIAMTANVMQGDRDSCLQAGMDDYISKPIEMSDLLAQLEKWSLVIRENRK